VRFVTRSFFHPGAFARCSRSLDPGTRASADAQARRDSHPGLRSGSGPGSDPQVGRPPVDHPFDGRRRVELGIHPHRAGQGRRPRAGSAKHEGLPEPSHCRRYSPDAAQAVQKYLQKMSATPPSDKYAHEGKGWWEIVVSNDQWVASRAQLQQLFHPATADPSVKLELSADDLLAHGSYFEAVSGYVAAAAAAVNGPTVLPDRFKALLEKAHDVLAKFTLSTTSPALATRVGEPFPSAVQVHLNYGTDPGSPAIANASLRFSYKAKVNGHVAITGQSLVTDAQGAAAFALPTPDFAARDKLTVLVDVNPWLEALASAPKDLRDPVADLENLAGAARLQLPYTVESASKLVPMIVALADLDEKGGLLRRQESTGALISALQKAGFISSGVQVNLSLLKSPNDNVILTAWKFQGKSTGRAVYGTVSVVSVTPNGNQFDAEVLGSVKVADLATNKPVFQQKTSKVATGPDRASAISLALRGWSADAAATMDDTLP